jgi:hypothetical protein
MCEIIILSIFFGKEKEKVNETEVHRPRAVAQWYAAGRYAAGNTFAYQVASTFVLEIRDPRTGFGLEWSSFLDACSAFGPSWAIRSLPKHERRKNEIRQRVI